MIEPTCKTIPLTARIERPRGRRTRLRIVPLLLVPVLCGSGVAARAADYTWGYYAKASPPAPDGYLQAANLAYSATGDPFNLGSTDTLEIYELGEGYLSGTLSNSGSVVLNPGNGPLFSDGTLSNQAGGTVVFGAKSFLDGSACGPVNQFVSGCGNFVNAGNTVIGAPGANTLDMTFTTSGTLTFDIGGSSNYGSLAALGGSTTLGGRFAVSLASGFTPTMGESFQVMSFAAFGVPPSYSGAFVDGSVVEDGVTFTANYTSSAVDLVVTSVAPSIPEPPALPMLLAGMGLVPLGLRFRKAGPQESPPR